MELSTDRSMISWSARSADRRGAASAHAARRADDDVLSRAQRFLAAYTAGDVGASVPGCDPSASDKGKSDSALVVKALRGAP